jgi:hypothetical protein
MSFDVKQLIAKRLPKSATQNRQHDPAETGHCSSAALSPLLFAQTDNGSSRPLIKCNSGSKCRGFCMTTERGQAGFTGAHNYIYFACGFLDWRSGPFMNPLLPLPRLSWQLLFFANNHNSLIDLWKIGVVFDVDRPIVLLRSLVFV